MKTEVFLNLLEDPKGVQQMGVDELRELALAYPYSQVIQLLYGIRLRYSSEHLFNQQLGKAAALSNDRSVLFELFEDKPKVQSPTSSIKARDIVEEQAQVIGFSPGKEESDESTKSAAPLDTPIEKKEEYDEPTPLEIPKAEKLKPKAPVEYSSAKPDGLENLSPQDRVKAILERNRELRQQFEDQKSDPNKEEKMFSEPSKGAKPEAKKLEDSLQDLREEAKEDIEKETKAQDDLSNAQEPAQAEELDSAPEDKDLSESSSETDDSPYRDHPIDITDLIRRRYRSRFETTDSAPEEEETATEEIKAEADADAKESSLADEVHSSEEERLEEITSSESEKNIDPDPEQIDESDLGMSVRIRGIRARLERLKQEDALSEEEMSALMDEHEKLEELLSLLPTEDDHVFEVEVSQEEEKQELEELEAKKEDLPEPEGESEQEQEELEQEEVRESEEKLVVEEEQEIEQELEKGQEEAEKESEQEQEQEESKQEPKQEQEEPEQEEVRGSEEKLVVEEEQKIEHDLEQGQEEPEKEPEKEPRQESEQEQQEIEQELEEEPQEVQEEKLKDALDTDKEGLDTNVSNSKDKLEEAKTAIEPISAPENAGEKKEKDKSKKKEVEEASSESEKEPPTLEEEINRIEALAERLRFERKGPAKTSSIFSAEATEDKEPIAKEEKKPEESPADLSAKEAPETEGESVASVTETEDNSDELPTVEAEDKDDQLGSSIEEGADELVRELEEDIAELEDEAHLEQAQEIQAEGGEQEDVLPEPNLEPEQELEDNDKSHEEAESHDAAVPYLGPEVAESNEEAEFNLDADKLDSEESSEEESPSFGALLKRLNSQGAKNAKTEAEEEAPEEKESQASVSKSEISEKIDLIDAFVEKLPDLKKKKPLKSELINAPELKTGETSETEQVTLVTETLAKVYIKQGHFKKAIQAYEILRLKYPEKSTFFASRISEIKKLSKQ